MSNSSSLPHFLIVDDSEDDTILICRAFARAHMLNPIHVVHNGQDAIDYLNGQGSFADRETYPLPQIVLLDLKMPGLDGFDVLMWIRHNQALNELRVIVLTSSTDVRDANLAFQLGANGFVIKPADFLRFVEFSEALDGHWLWSKTQPLAPQPEPDADRIATAVLA